MEQQHCVCVRACNPDDHWVCDPIANDKPPRVWRNLGRTDLWLKMILNNLLKYRMLQDRSLRKYVKNPLLRVSDKKFWWEQDKESEFGLTRSPLPILRNMAPNKCLQACSTVLRIDKVGGFTCIPATPRPNIVDESTWCQQASRTNWPLHLRRWYDALAKKALWTNLFQTFGTRSEGIATKWSTNRTTKTTCSNRSIPNGRLSADPSHPTSCQQLLHRRHHWCPWCIGSNLWRIQSPMSARHMKKTKRILHDQLQRHREFISTRGLTVGFQNVFALWRAENT